ncbi:trans-sialidase [Trypanosoma cruzi Dm28c]|uniref:Trans-sialidase n=2 Tax=Trypanosoma cruzi TaxID=5693 RepID=V5ATX4_TRYCR|nr:trans-sialidase [Trypanosoma cruzi Dm28c]PWV01115.1 putative trans-sialidase [Trypanosoma cruzi]
MLPRVAAVMAPRTHNRRRVTESSGRKREGRESEPPRPNMSRRVLTSAVLLILLVMIFCGAGGAKTEEDQSSDPNFKWTDITEGEGETVDSLGVPGLLKVGSDVFAVAEAHCKKDGETSVFTGIASQLLSNTADNKPEEVLKNAKDTQVLEKGGSKGKKKEVDVSRPTAVVKESDIYMLVGKYGGEGDAACQGASDVAPWGLLLLKGNVSDGESAKRILWQNTYGLPCIFTVEHHASLTGLIAGGGSGVKMNDGTLVFPVEATKKETNNEDEVKTTTVSLVLYTATGGGNLSKGMSADGCSDPSVVEWKGKLMMMTACDDGRRRVYEIGDKGESWTEALGTLSRVWGNNQKRHEKGVRSGFITATFGDGGKRNVMLVTLPVYSKKTEGVSANGKGVLHLWLTDNTHIVDIGPVSGEDEDVAASSLLYKSETNEEKLIALYEKRKGAGEKPSHSLWTVLLTEQLQRVKEALATWKEVDERVSKLCPSENAEHDSSTATACSTGKITDGLVGFLSGNFSDGTWKDEYLGVNATVNKGAEEGAAAEKADSSDGVKFHGAWAEWPVGKQGDNQLYHFANYNFTLVATVSVHEAPEGNTPIPLMGAKINDGDNNPVLLGLSYNKKEEKWILLCGGQTTTEHSSHSETDNAQYQVAIVLQNGTQGSAYVDGQRVWNAQCELENTNSKGISHFYIGGDGGSAGNTAGDEGVSVTVSNVLLYNRPLDEAEITALNAKLSIPKATEAKTVKVTPPEVTEPATLKTETMSILGEQQQTEQDPLGTSENAGSGGLFLSGLPTATNSTAAKESEDQSASGTSPSGNKNVDGTPSSDADPAVVTRSGDTVQGGGSPQTPEESVSSGEDGVTAEGTDEQGEEGIHSQNREVNATALNSSLGNLSQGNNTDAGGVRGSGLLQLPSLLLLLGLWGFAAL